MTRAISVVAVVVCLNGYNTELDKRDHAEEHLREQQAELEQEQSVDAAKEGTTTDGAYKDGTYTEEAQGFGGPIDVAVIIENGKISEIKRIIKVNHGDVQMQGTVTEKDAVK